MRSSPPTGGRLRCRTAAARSRKRSIMPSMSSSSATTWKLAAGIEVLVGGAEHRPGRVGRTEQFVEVHGPGRRVDAIVSGAAVVFTRIASVQLVDGVEVLFRRETGEYLVVAKGGRIVVRS